MLDLGCGTGRIAATLARHFKFVDGIDISSKMIEIAKRDHPNIKNLQFHLGNGVNLQPFLENFFDFVFFSGFSTYPPKINNHLNQ